MFTSSILLYCLSFFSSSSCFQVTALLKAVAGLNRQGAAQFTCSICLGLTIFFYRSGIMLFDGAQHFFFELFRNIKITLMLTAVCVGYVLFRLHSEHTHTIQRVYHSKKMCRETCSMKNYSSLLHESFLKNE